MAKDFTFSKIEVFKYAFLIVILTTSWGRGQTTDCSTPDGRLGICVAEQYCRMTPAHKQCYGNGPGEHVCCPIPDDLTPPTSPSPRPALAEPRSTGSPSPRYREPLTPEYRATTPYYKDRPTKSPFYRPTTSSSFTKPECGAPVLKRLIAGGVEARPGDWPWMTAISRRNQRTNSYVYICGGVLLTTKFVLSAAHCFTCGHNVCSATLYILRLGSHDRENGGTERGVSIIRLHEDYDVSRGDNDIALLRLSEAVTFSTLLSPVCLPPGSLAYDDLAGRNGTVIGWGHTSAWSGSSKFLNQVILPIISMKECSQAYQGGGTALFPHDHLDSMLCAGRLNDGRDSCQGDSGGPMVLRNSNNRWTIVGIVSFGPSICGSTGFPGVYTRVAYYMNWIKSTLRTL